MVRIITLQNHNPMKKTVLLLLLVLGMQSAGSQWINAIQLDPPYPTSADTLRFYADCSFPNGSFGLFQLTQSVAGNDIWAYALHCMGMLTVICSYTDTIIVPPQPPGTYTFHFSLDAGLLPSCTPGIVPGPTDTIVFVITPPAGIPGLPGTGFSLRCDPVTAELVVDVPSTLDGTTLEIYGVDGRLMKNLMLPKGRSSWTLDIPPGIYLAHLPETQSLPVKFVVTR